MTFKKLADYFAELEKTASRNQMTEILAKLLKEASVVEVDKICYLALGRLAPLYEGIEFNLAEKMMIRALSQAYKKEEAEIKKKYKLLGDLGDTAAFFDKRQKSKPLSVEKVYSQLREIAFEAGEGSVERKINKTAQLLDDLDNQSAKYVVRIPLGKLRLGFSDMTILDALSWMINSDKSKRLEIEIAYNARADIGQIAKLIKKDGLKGLRSLRVQLGVPVMPALCQRLPTAEEIIKKMANVAVEPKYDGTRLQIHFSHLKRWEKIDDQLDFDFQPKSFVRIFTRNLENVTHMFPDIVSAVLQEVKAQEAILDCEAIGYDPKTGKFLPFQETIKRKRKHQVSVTSKEIPLKCFCFDILYKDGRDLLKTPFNERREILEKILGVDKTIMLTPQIITNDPEKLRQSHVKYIKAGLEGVVVKKWEAGYDPGRRGYTWVKLKSEETKKGAGLADTLDCVVMGYNRGKGKRVSFGIGAFLVGVRRGNQFLTVSKIGTGLTDDQWREMHQRCEAAKANKQPKQFKVDKNLAPDVWCQPKIVVEIQADNITKSPIHTAKYAFRFPRLIRFRDDKSVFQTTTLAEVEKLYQLQK